MDLPATLDYIPDNLTNRYLNMMGRRGKCISFDSNMASFLAIYIKFQGCTYGFMFDFLPPQVLFGKAWGQKLNIWKLTNLNVIHNDKEQ